MTQAIHAEIKRKYQALTAADKSCVRGTLQHAKSTQLTTKESLHNEFYETLAKIGWSKSVPVSPELEELNSFASWELTSDGYENLPKLLHAIDFEETRDRYENQAFRQLAVIALKFLTCYVCFYALVAFVGYYSVKFGLPLEKIKKELSLLTVLCGFIISATISLKNWGIGKQRQYGLLPLAYLRFLESRVRVLALMYPVLVIAISIGFESFIYLNDPDRWHTTFESKKLIGTALIGIVIGAIGWSFLPQYIARKIREILRQFS